jgi:hypothetical protein
MNMGFGEINVPGHTQMVTFFLWGFPKESYFDGDDIPRVIGEMDRDTPLAAADDHLADLSRIALAAYNHGAMRIVLTKHKAYLVTSGATEEAAYEASRDTQ